MDIFQLPHELGIVPTLIVRTNKHIDMCTGSKMETSTIKFSLMVTPELESNVFTKSRKVIELSSERTISELTVNIVEFQINSIKEEWLEEVGEEEYMVSTPTGLAKLNLSELTVDSDQLSSLLS